MIQREDYELLRKLVAETLDAKITDLVNSRLDKMEEKLAKLETIDRILLDVKSLFI